MKNLRNLLAALVIFALLPLANTASAQVTVYNHGKKVQVAKTTSKTWSNIKHGVTTESRRIGHATTEGWNGLKTGGFNGMTHGVSNGYNNPGTMSSTTTTYQSTYQPAYRTGTRTSYTRSTTYGRTMSMRERARLNRARLMRERIAREHRLQSYHARVARQR